MDPMVIAVSTAHINQAVTCASEVMTPATAVNHLCQIHHSKRL